MCNVAHSFNIVVDAGSLDVLLIPSSKVAGLNSVNYNFSMNLSHSIDSSAKISFYFSSTYFSIGSGITCQTSLSTNCTVITNANNLVEVRWVTVGATTAVDVVLMGFTNPPTVGTFTAISISTYVLVSSIFYMVDSNQGSASFLLEARPMQLTDMNISSSSSTVYSPTTLTTVIRNNNKIPDGAYFVLYVPV